MTGRDLPAKCEEALVPTNKCYVRSSSALSWWSNFGGIRFWGRIFFRSWSQNWSKENSICSTRYGCVRLTSSVNVIWQNVIPRLRQIPDFRCWSERPLERSLLHSVFASSFNHKFGRPKKTAHGTSHRWRNLMLEFQFESEHLPTSNSVYIPCCRFCVRADGSSHESLSNLLSITREIADKYVKQQSVGILGLISKWATNRTIIQAALQTTNKLQNCKLSNYHCLSFKNVVGFFYSSLCYVVKRITAENLLPDEKQTFIT